MSVTSNDMAAKLARKCSLISSEVGNHKIVNMHNLGMFMNYSETKHDKNILDMTS